MATYINGRDELVVTIEKLEKVAEEMQKQADKQWKISLCVSLTALTVATAAIVVAVLNYLVNI